MEGREDDGDGDGDAVSEDEEGSEDSASSSFSGPLFELSDLMANLPIKRGLSRYYEGKSKSFTCLGRPTSLEDLIKKDYTPYNKRIRSSKSYAANIGSDPHHRHRRCVTGRSYSPKATIAKKGSRITSPLPSPTGKRAMTSPGSTAQRKE